MAHIFISYSRIDEQFAHRIAAALSDVGADVWIDVEDIPAGMKWSSAIQQGLRTSDVMIIIISPDSMASNNVEDEWQYYLDQGKDVIPIQYRPADVHFQLSRIQYVDFHAQEFDTAFSQLHAELRRKGVQLDPLSERDESVQLAAQKPLPVRPVPSEGRTTPRYWLIGGIIVVIGMLSLLVVFGNEIVRRGNSSGLEVEITNLAQTIEALTAIAMPVTATAEAWTDTPPPIDTTTQTPTTSATDTPIRTATPTNTPAATVTPIQSPFELARTPVASNDDWTPYSQTFDGVEMMLVPMGCFMMGSNDGDEDEQPVHEQCFDEPFWISKTEVTNEQYGSLGCELTSSEPNQPRNCIDWFEAQNFCEAHGGRLPTEAEWEYAARGPDNLVYPWGNEFIGDYVIYESSPIFGDTTTAPVSSRPGGASWSGALDMSGNVWEWISSLYESYPYNVDDERDSNNSNDSHVLRGGSFDFSMGALRTANRSREYSGFGDDGIGFRCVRDVEP